MRLAGVNPRCFPADPKSALPHTVWGEEECVNPRIASTDGTNIMTPGCSTKFAALAAVYISPNCFLHSFPLQPLSYMPDTE